MAVILQGEFAPSKPCSFDYPSFRAEFVRLKQKTSFERIQERAARAQQAAQAALITQCPTTVDGVPFWAEFQKSPGIMNTIHTWKAERYEDPDRSRIRFTLGLLEQVETYQVEPLALDALENEALTWTAARGRTTVTTNEHRALALSKRYLSECDTHKFRAKNSGFEPSYRPDGSLVESIMYRWIARVMLGDTGKLATSIVKEYLLSVERVYALRAILGMNAAPDVRVMVRREQVSDTQREEAA